MTSEPAIPPTHVASTRSRLRRYFRTPSGRLLVLWGVLLGLNVLISLVSRFMDRQHANTLLNLLVQVTGVLASLVLLLGALLELWRVPSRELALLALSVLVFVVYISYWPFFFGENVTGVETGPPINVPGFDFLMVLGGWSGLVLLVRMMRLRLGSSRPAAAAGGRPNGQDIPSPGA